MHLLLLLFWHAPLGVLSTIQLCSVWGCRLSNVLDGVQPCDMRTPQWSLPVIWGAFRITLITVASASSSIRAICPNMERHPDWITVVRLGCVVILLISSFRTNWCHLIPSSVLKHHWWRASILHASTMHQEHKNIITQNKLKQLKSADLVTSYDLWPGNRAGYSQRKR